MAKITTLRQLKKVQHLRKLTKKQRAKALDKTAERAKPEFKNPTQKTIQTFRAQRRKLKSEGIGLGKKVRASNLLKTQNRTTRGRIVG